jgi:hypothetical protein
MPGNAIPPRRERRGFLAPFPVSIPGPASDGFIDAVAGTAYDSVHESCEEDCDRHDCSGGSLQFWERVTGDVLAALAEHAVIIPREATS